MKHFRILFPLYVVVTFCFLLYSFTQIDLGLTLSQASLWQHAQQFFIGIGYYARPISTGIYVVLLIALYILYAATVVLVRSGKLSERHIWFIIAGVVCMLLFSYPAFSHDIFNYMFTAKTIIVYGKNPYEVTPLMFTGVENWLSFMRWTHLPSAYTPLWILLSLPTYLFGFGYLLPVLWNMKILIAFFYLLSVYLIRNILKVVDSRNATLGVALFALHPLVLIETLISGHNDIVMPAFALLSLFAYIHKHTVRSFFLFGVSVAVKLMTIVLFPVVLLGWNRQLAVVAMTLAIVLVSFQREILPWYMVWIIPFVALCPRKINMQIFFGIVTFGFMLRYVPFLYFGHWDPPVSSIIQVLSVVPITVAMVYGAYTLMPTVKNVIFPGHISKP